MRLKTVAKWTGIVLVGLVLLAIVLLWFIDRRLNPPVDAPVLGSILIPASDEPLDQDVVVFDSDESGNFEVWVMGRDGSDAVQLTNDTTFDSWWVRLSPDRQTILFYRTPAGVHDGDFTKTSLWMAPADGGEPVEVLPVGSHGWNMHGHAEWSPDGTQLTMFGGKRSNPQIWVTSSDGRTIVNVADDPGTNIDPSWSPDGSKIVYVGCPSRVCFNDAQELYLVPATGGERERLTSDEIRDHDPYYSPDGTMIGFLSQVQGADDGQIAGIWDIRVVPSDLSLEPRRVVGDDQINSMPKWLDDSSIIFHRLEYGSGRGFDIWEVDVTTGETQVVRETTANEEYPDPGQ